MGFPTTRWSLILASRQGAAARREALEALFTTYWKPLYFYLRWKGLAVEVAEDAVQGLFAQLLERDFLERLDPARGRFRSYLKTAADHHLVDLHEKDAARKRGGDFRFVSLDVVLAERDLPGVPERPDDAYDREWALEVMERAVSRLRRDYEDGTRRGRPEVVLRFFSLEAAPSYAEAAAASAMSVPQFKAALHRARRRFREILREEVAGTVDDPAQAEAELRELRRLLGSAGA